mmetsp:Transcript_24160/g.75572  ORF Transcript_24160/g.75572 Transcript_24160/m.75572 type:complete len:258 (-) Transcript_24160:306-1079(-)
MSAAASRVEGGALATEEACRILAKLAADGRREGDGGRKRQKRCESRESALVGAVLGVSESMVGSVLTVVEPPEWREVEPRAYMSQEQLGWYRSLAEGDWRQEELSTSSRPTKFKVLASLLFDLPVAKAILGLSSDAPTIRGQYDVLHCGWCEAHLADRVARHERALCLDRLQSRGGCTRCFRLVGFQRRDGSWGVRCEVAGHHQLFWAPTNDPDNAISCLKQVVPALVDQGRAGPPPANAILNHQQPGLFRRQRCWI